MTGKKPNPGASCGDASATEKLMPHLEGVPEAMRPIMQFGAKMQAECMTLWSQRAQEWLNWPERICGCKTTSDLASAQSEYVATMRRHYAEYMDCILRDTLIEQDELQDKEPVETPQESPAEPHRQAA